MTLVLPFGPLRPSAIPMAISRRSYSSAYSRQQSSALPRDPHSTHICPLPTAVLFALACVPVLHAAGAVPPQQSVQLPPFFAPQARGVSAPDVIANAMGVVRADHRVLGLGPGYRARFAHDGVTFCAVRATDAPTLVWKLDTIGRRMKSDMLAESPLSAAPPEILGSTTVVYRRGYVTERYEARTDGIEQSLVFQELPQGTGDLVVRLALQTALVPSGSGMDVEELAFTAPFQGVASAAVQTVISIGKVTGIDAQGGRAMGWMRLENGFLELVLPAAFVDRATLPLTLDPLIGSPIFAGYTGSNPLSSWDVTYDTGSDVFLVAWTEGTSTSGYESFGQLVRANGVIVGSPFCLECSSSDNGKVRSIASVRSRERFVVWTSDYSPITVHAPSGAVIVAANIAPRFHWIAEVALGGESELAHDNVLLARRDSQLGAIAVEKYRVDAAGGITPEQSLQLGPGDGAVHVSPTGGQPGRYLVVWENQGSIEGAVLDRALTILDQGIVRRSPAQLVGPRVSGDGRQWIVSYQEISPYRAWCVPVYWSQRGSKAWVGNEAPISVSPIVDVAWMGESCLLSHIDSCYQAVISVDPFTCHPCEGWFPISTTCLEYAAFLIGSQGDVDPIGGGDLAFLSGDARVVRRFRADDGIVQDLGGGCGNSGWSAATCARVGNGSFTLRLRDAQPGSAAYLVLGTQQVGFACGTCTLIPNPTIVVGVGLTDANGNAEVRAPIPNQPGLLGATFLEQWLTIAGNACPLGLEFSNALSVTLQ